MSDEVFYVRCGCKQKEGPTPEGQLFWKTLSFRFLKDYPDTELQEIVSTDEFKRFIQPVLQEMCEKEGMILSRYKISVSDDFESE